MSLTSLYAHDRRAHLRTPAVSAFRRAAKSRNDHNVKGPVLFHDCIWPALKAFKLLIEYLESTYLLLLVLDRW